MFVVILPFDCLVTEVPLPTVGTLTTTQAKLSEVEIGISILGRT